MGELRRQEERSTRNMRFDTHGKREVVSCVDCVLEHGPLDGHGLHRTRRVPSVQCLSALLQVSSRMGQGCLATPTLHRTSGTDQSTRLQFSLMHHMTSSVRLPRPRQGQDEQHGAHRFHEEVVSVADEMALPVPTPSHATCGVRRAAPGHVKGPLHATLKGRSSGC